MTAQIITVTNLKGGVGKTTTTLALTCAAVAGGMRTLCIDLDPTGGLSSTLERKGTYPATLYDVLKGRRIPLKAALVSHHLGAMPDGRQLLYTVPADQRMDKEGTSAEDLREMLAPVMEEFDIILIDTQPHRPGIIGPIEVCDFVVIPTMLEMLSMRTAAMTVGLIMKLDAAHKLKGLAVTGERRPLILMSAKLLEGLKMNGLCFSEDAILWWNGGWKRVISGKGEWPEESLLEIAKKLLNEVRTRPAPVGKWQGFLAMDVARRVAAPAGV